MSASAQASLKNLKPNNDKAVATRRRKNDLWTPAVVRSRIQVANIEKRLIKFFLGRIKLTATQANVGLRLLGKIVPDLQTIELHGDLDLNVIQAEPVKVAAWLGKHGETYDGEAELIESVDAKPVESKVPTLTPNETVKS